MQKRLEKKEAAAMIIGHGAVGAGTTLKTRENQKSLKSMGKIFLKSERDEK